MIDAAEPPQRVQATWGFVFAFVALALVVHEAHELAHITVGRLVCGGWGARDFNSWTLTGRPGVLLQPDVDRKLASRFLFPLAPPRARPGLRAQPFRAAPDGRDGWRRRRGPGPRGDGLPRGRAATVLAVVPVAILVAFPLWRAWNSLATRRRLLVFIALLLLPTLVTGVLLLVAGNRLLAAGLLAGPEIAGTPPLIWLIALAAVGLLLLLRGHLQRGTRHPSGGSSE